MPYSDYSSIERCPHDDENPYAQISNDLIRDQSISPNCRWLIIYLLSNRGNWKIKVSQVVHHLNGQMSRGKVYKIINEAREAGYIMREDFKIPNIDKNGKNRGGFHNRCRYFVSEKPKFKDVVKPEEIQHDEIQHAGTQDTGNRHAKEEHKKENYLKKEHTSKSASPPVCPAEAGEKKKTIEELVIAASGLKLPFEEKDIRLLCKKHDPNLVREKILMYYKLYTKNRKTAVIPIAWLKDALAKDYKQTKLEK